jgi:hypothetical protein
MNIGIKKTTQDAGSAVLIRDDSRSELLRSRSRVTRTATLDLETVIDNQGYAVGDRTLKIVASVEESKADEIWDLYKNNLYLLISTRDGMFYGSIEDLKIDGGRVEMTFLVKE